MRVDRIPAHQSRTLVMGALGIALFVTGCGGAVAPDESPSLNKASSPEVPASPPSISGTITRLVPGDSIVRVSGASGSPLRSVLIEGAARADGTGRDKSVVLILAGARVLRRRVAGVERAGFDDLLLGQRVSAWFDGTAQLSYPTQAKAAVVIIER